VCVPKKRQLMMLCYVVRYVRYVVGGYERCNDGGLASGANGPSPAQSRAIAAIETRPTIGGSCTCFQNLRKFVNFFRRISETETSLHGS